MRMLSFYSGLCISLFMSQAAVSQTVEWSVGADAALAAALAPSSFLIAPAAYATPEESFLSSAVRRIETSSIENYSAATFFNQSGDVWLDLSGVMAGLIYNELTAEGAGHKQFHFEDEGWFGKDTYSLGMDKLGHAYASYLYAEYFNQRISHSRSNAEGAGITSGLLAFGVQAVVEVTDGFSSVYGFSKNDLIANGVGASLSMLRSTVPGFAEKIDFRMEYDPWVNGVSTFSPYNDYSNQKYLLALKLSGFEQFEDSPLRFVELHAGYFARGFGAKGEPAIAELRREPYVAIGMNLAELFNVAPVRNTLPAQVARRAFEYIQVPGTYVATVNK